MNDFDLINRKEALEARPERLNSSVERITEIWTLADRSYARGWNACIALWAGRIEELPPAPLEIKLKDAVRIVMNFLNTCSGGGAWIETPDGVILNTDWEYVTEGLKKLEEYAERQDT